MTASEKQKFLNFLATGATCDNGGEGDRCFPTLAKHDSRFHKDGYKEGDVCKYREQLTRRDGSDKIFQTPPLTPTGSRGTIQPMSGEDPIDQVVRLMGSGKLKSPWFKPTEVRASYGEQFRKLWWFLLLLGAADNDGRAGGKVDGGEGSAAATGRRASSKLRLLATRYGSHPESVIGDESPFLRQGRESKVFVLNPNRVIKLRKLRFYFLDDVRVALAKIVYHNYLFPKDAYALQDIAYYDDGKAEEFFAILEQPLVIPEMERRPDGQIGTVQPSYGQIFDALNKSPLDFEKWDEAWSHRTYGIDDLDEFEEDDEDASSSPPDFVQSSRVIAYNPDFYVHDFKPGENTFIEKGTGAVRFIDPKIDINDPGAGFSVSKFGSRKADFSAMSAPYDPQSLYDRLYKS